VVPKMVISVVFRDFLGRRDGDDSMAGEKSFMYGKSVSNQRIEAWWSFLRRSNMDWWINYFKDLRDCGIYNDKDSVQVECLKFCFMPVIQDELHLSARQWNLHNIRPSRNPNSPSGRPDTLFFLPESANTYNYLVSVGQDEVEIAEELLTEDPLPRGCSLEFQELALMIMEDHGLVNAENAQQALILYENIIVHLNNL